jgi:hypothetical protein
MSISLAGISAQNYIGTPTPLNMQIAGVVGRAVKLSFDWRSYGAGSATQNIVAAINLGSGRGTQAAPLLDLIRSIYIDNTGSAVPIFVQFDDTLFTVEIQPYSTGWYPVFTNGFAFHVAGFGFTDTNVSQLLMYITNVRVAPYTDSSLQAVLNEGLSSPIIGGGSGVGSIAPIIPGQDYNNGNLSISGGGGSGATALGTLDQWGRFVSVAILTSGTGYLGAVTIAPTGGQTIPAAFNPAGNYNINNKVQYLGTEWQWLGGGGLGGSIQCGAATWNNSTQYAQNTQVNYSGFIFQALFLTPAGAGPPPGSPSQWRQIGSATPLGGAGGWLNSGTPSGTTATFASTLTANSSEIISSGFAPEALGDQALNLIDTITGTGIFENNLFGTPFATGFIYLTHLDVNVLSFGAGTIWSIQNALGYAPFEFSPGQAGPQLSLQKMNMKIDATVDWQLKCTTHGSNVRVSHAFAWTYSQQ